MHPMTEERLCSFNLFTEQDEDDLKDVVYERLMEPTRFATDPDTDCMIFVGAWTERGVGRVRVGQRVYNVVRVAAWVFLGEPLWSDRCPYHRCPNPACFNPDHIGVAPSRSIAYALRSFDRIGRDGPRQPAIPRLTPRRAVALRAAAERGAPARDLARMFALDEAEVLAFFARPRPLATRDYASASRLAA